VSGDRLLTANEVAEFLSVSAETVLRWTRRGDLPGFRLPGGALRYRLEAIETWLAERETADTADRESPDARADRVRRPGRYSPPRLHSDPPDARPPAAASTEKET
jgi:excisionase family DNA binding protein